MLSTLGLLSVCAAGFAAEPEVVSLDLYAIGNNGACMENLDWMKNPDRQNPIQSALKPELDKLASEKRDFAILDGGQVSAFSKEREGRYILRKYESYDSAWETITKNGKKETRVLAHNETEETASGNFHSKSAQSRWQYMSATFWHLRKPGEMQSIGDYSLAIQDFNSYMMSRNTPVEQDRIYSTRTFMMSNNSIQQTKALLEKSAPDFNGIAFCAYGLPDPSMPNLVPVPPAGKVAHYVVTREKGKWSIKLVEYLRAPKAIRYS